MLRGIHRLSRSEPKWQAPTARLPSSGASFSSMRVEKRERAFRTDQDMRKIEVVASGSERIEIIAADAPLDLGKCASISSASRAAEAQGARARAGAAATPAGRSERSRRRPAEMRQRSIRQHSVDRENIVAHSAVAQRAPAAGIVPHHAADGRARGGRDVDRKPQAMRLQSAVEIVEDDARARPRSACRRRRAPGCGRDISSNR